MLHELTASNGRLKKAQRVGRGNGSKGNTCGKGTKGQKARAGGGVPDWFEGGQTPLFMRLPKLRGFKKYFKHLKNVVAVNVSTLEQHADIGTETITPQLLVDLGIVKSSKSTPKILGNTALTKKLTFGEGILFSASAQSSIENAGGSINS